MNAIEKIKNKYNTTPAPKNEEVKQTAADPAGRYFGYGCSGCGCDEYQLLDSKMWRCNGCGAIYPFIAKLEKHRSLETVKEARSCFICFSPWMIKTGNVITCPECNPIPENGVLVCVGQGLKAA